MWRGRLSYTAAQHSIESSGSAEDLLITTWRASSANVIEYLYSGARDFGGRCRKLCYTPFKAAAHTLHLTDCNSPSAFRTDTEISRTGPMKRERELQAWQPEAHADGAVNGNGVPASALGSPPRRGGGVDDLTFGSDAAGGPWDQFAANQRLFGVTTQFDEDAYTTKLDRSGKDFKDKEKRAERIAAEIMNVRFLWCSGFLPLVNFVLLKISVDLPLLVDIFCRW